MKNKNTYKAPSAELVKIFYGDALLANSLMFGDYEEAGGEIVDNEYEEAF